jgi:hypothetical protein
MNDETRAVRSPRGSLRETSFVAGFAWARFGAASAPMGVGRTADFPSVGGIVGAPE